MVPALTEFPRVLVPTLAAEIGVGRERIRTEVRRGNWRTMTRGAVLTRPEVPTRGDWAALGIALGGPSAALSGWDALRVRGLASCSPPANEVLVLSQHASNRVVGSVRIRETDRPYTTTLTSVDAGQYSLVPIVSTARAVADASRYCRRLGPVRGMLTGAVQRRLCTIEELVHELRTGPRNDTALYRVALSDALDGARSVAEAQCVRRLSRARVPPFELNVPIFDRSGTLVAVADVLWRALRAVLEVDSREYHFSERDWKQTMARHNRLTRLGLAVTHYPPSVVSGKDRAWLDEVRDWLEVRSRELGIAWPRGRGVLRPADSDPEPRPLSA